MFEINSSELSQMYSNEGVVPVMLDTTVVESPVCVLEPPEIDPILFVVTDATEDNNSPCEGNSVPSPEVQPIGV